MGYPVDIAI